MVSKTSASWAARRRAAASSSWLRVLARRAASIISSSCARLSQEIPSASCLDSRCLTLSKAHTSALFIICSLSQTCTHGVVQLMILVASQTSSPPHTYTVTQTRTLMCDVTSHDHSTTRSPRNELTALLEEPTRMLSRCLLHLARGGADCGITNPVWRQCNERTSCRQESHLAQVSSGAPVVYAAFRRQLACRRWF